MPRLWQNNTAPNAPNASRSGGIPQPLLGAIQPEIAEMPRKISVKAQEPGQNRDFRVERVVPHPLLPQMLEFLKHFARLG